MIELTQRDNVESYIGNNLEVLEDILDRAAQRYSRMQEEKDKLSLGCKLTHHTLNELLPGVTQKTREFLEVSEAPTAYFSIFHLPTALEYGAYVTLGTFTFVTLPNLIDGLTAQDIRTAGTSALLFGAAVVLSNYRDYSVSVFDREKKLVRISNKRAVPAVASIAHEYTHHLQDNLTCLLAVQRNPIAEGHARGVEGAIAALFAQEHDNPAYAFDNIGRTAKELKDSYLYICSEKGITPRESLANSAVPRIRGWLYKRFWHHYSIGVAAMSIANEKHGEHVYRDVVKSNFEFLRA